MKSGVREISGRIVFVVAPVLAGSEKIRDAVEDGNIQVRGSVDERIRIFMRRLLAEEAFHMSFGSYGGTEDGVKGVHVVNGAAVIAGVEFHVAFDEIGDVVAEITVTVVIAEQHSHGRGGAAVHVFHLRNFIGKNDVPRSGDGAGDGCVRKNVFRRDEETGIFGNCRYGRRRRNRLRGCAIAELQIGRSGSPSGGRGKRFSGFRAFALLFREYGKCQWRRGGGSRFSGQHRSAIRFDRDCKEDI